MTSLVLCTIIGIIIGILIVWLVALSPPFWQTPEQRQVQWEQIDRYLAQRERHQ